MVHLSNMSYLGVVMAALVAFIFSGLWYTVFFGKMWKEEMGIDEAKEKEMLDDNAPAKAMIIAFITGLISTFVMAYLLHAMDMLSMKQALMFSFTIGLGIVGVSMISDGYYDGHSLKLIVINTVYRILQIMIASVVYVLLANFGWQG